MTVAKGQDGRRRIRLEFEEIVSKKRNFHRRRAFTTFFRAAAARCRRCRPPTPYAVLLVAGVVVDGRSLVVRAQSLSYSLTCPLRRRLAVLSLPLPHSCPPHALAAPSPQSSSETLPNCPTSQNPHTPQAVPHLRVCLLRLLRRLRGAVAQGKIETHTRWTAKHRPPLTLCTMGQCPRVPTRFAA